MKDKEIKEYSTSKAYNSTITIPNYWYRDSSNLTGEEQHYRWAFKGWTEVPYQDNINLTDAYIDTSNLLVTKHINLYAHYVKEDCRLVASNSDYFIAEGTAISLNPSYKYKLQGKITVPS